MNKPTLGSVILAAGFSKRFGPANKLLATAGGRPIIESVLDTIVACPFDHVVVVVQSTDDGVGVLAKRFPVTIAVNPQPSAGMGSSLACAACELQDKGLDGVAIFPGDVPFIKPATIARLCSEFVDSGCNTIIRPFVGEQPGHPVLFPGDLIDELCQLTGDVGGRVVIDRYSERVQRVQVEDRGVVLDVDEPTDLHG
ncbi:MAG: nucleotidyltransferase family protein [Pirellulaceae bacterium]